MTQAARTHAQQQCRRSCVACADGRWSRCRAAAARNRARADGRLFAGLRVESLKSGSCHGGCISSIQREEESMQIGKQQPICIETQWTQGVASMFCMFVSGLLVLPAAVLRLRPAVLSSRVTRSTVTDAGSTWPGFSGSTHR